MVFLASDVIARLAGSSNLLDWASDSSPHPPTRLDTESDTFLNETETVCNELARWAANAAAQPEVAAQSHAWSNPSPKLIEAALPTSLDHQTQDDISGMGHERFDSVPGPDSNAPWQVKNQPRSADQQEGPLPHTQP